MKKTRVKRTSGFVYQTFKGTIFILTVCEVTELCRFRIQTFATIHHDFNPGAGGGGGLGTREILGQSL
jgi:hypothetical protein